MTIGNTTLPVTISNDMSHAVPVKVSVTPWDYHGSCNLGSGLSECYAIGQTAVPANGQILQTIACNGQLPAGDTGYVDVQYRNEANPFDSAYRDVEFPLQRVGPSPYEGVDEYAGVQNVSVPVYTAFNVIVVHTASVSGKVSCTAAGYQF